MAKNKKIKVLIRGGMGNQMFQVAFAKVLAIKYELELEFVDFSNRARVERNWSLSCFGIEPTSVSAVAKIILAIRVYFYRNIRAFLPNKLSPVLIEVKEFVGPPDIKIPPELISGYWQGVRYFLNCQSEIKEGFEFPALPENYQNVFSSIATLPLVAIHIRRGDYASDPVAKSSHLVCTPKWYEDAWNSMRNRLGDCQAVIFSDDIEWVRNNIYLEGNVSYMENTDDLPVWIDMSRMASCDHFIISNSTFSWWAAWLAKSNNKIVIAPSYWFRGVFTKDLGICPDEWILL